MKSKYILSGSIGVFLLFGGLACHAAKWDKNSFNSKEVASAYYDAANIKVVGKTVNWTEKYVFTKDGTATVSKDISKYDACKMNIEKYGPATQSLTEYQMKKDQVRLVSKRYYSEANKELCTEKDMGKDFNLSWTKIERFSQIEQAKYDLVTKYKVAFPN